MTIRITPMLSPNHEAKRRAAGRSDVTLGELLTREEINELDMLEMTIDTLDRAFDRRQAAIDRDKAAGRFWRLKGPHSPDPASA
jgi:hypothetical protein